MELLGNTPVDLTAHAVRTWSNGSALNFSLAFAGQESVTGPRSVSFAKQRHLAVNTDSMYIPGKCRCWRFCRSSLERRGHASDI